jgi:hypothetical protein
VQGGLVPRARQARALPAQFRSVDVGSLVQADAASGTFMFTIMQTKVIRIQVFVPQDRAFGLGPGVEAVVRVPEIPDRTFTGK